MSQPIKNRGKATKQEVRSCLSKALMYRLRMQERIVILPIGSAAIIKNMFWLISVMFALKKNILVSQGQDMATCHGNLIDAASILDFIEGFKNKKCTGHKFCPVFTKLHTDDLQTRPHKSYMDFRFFLNRLHVIVSEFSVATNLFES